MKKLLIFTLLCSASCVAQSSGYYQKTEVLLKDCKQALQVFDYDAKYSPDQLSRTQQCTSYVTGVLDTVEFMKAMRDANGKWLAASAGIQLPCLPKSINVQRVIRLFVAYVDSNPDQLDLPAPTAIVNSISKYHCD